MPNKFTHGKNFEFRTSYRCPLVHFVLAGPPFLRMILTELFQEILYSVGLFARLLHHYLHWKYGKDCYKCAQPSSFKTCLILGLRAVSRLYSSLPMCVLFPYGTWEIIITASCQTSIVWLPNIISNVSNKENDLTQNFTRNWVIWIL